MSHVEDLATEIKMETSDPSSFELIKEARSPPNCKTQRLRRCGCHFVLSSTVGHMTKHNFHCPKLDPSCKCFNVSGAHK